MKSILTLSALLCAACPGWTHAAPPAAFDRIAEPIAPRNIQILLEKDKTEALLEVKGPYYIFNPHDGSRVASGLLGKRFMIHEQEGGLKWGEEFPGIHQIYIKGRSPETAIFINGIQYPGGVAIYGVSGMINVVNDIDIESYVKALLTSQFPSPLEPEVMSSLAILTRTDAYYRSIQNEDSFWHVAATDVNYIGNALIVPNSVIDRSVDKTKDLILVRNEGEKHLPFPTTWTEHSGGKTASYESLFRKESLAPEKGVEAPLAAINRKNTKWSYQISKKALAQQIGAQTIKSIETFVDKSSNKVYALRVQDAHEAHDIDFFALQQFLGKEHLLSSDFTVAIKDDMVLFSGHGKGHGAGLCLYSASALAEKGENAVKILSKFFPETYLYNINAQPFERVER